jgi:hypothetical protein
MTRLIIPVLVALLVSGPVWGAWGEADRLLLRCEQDKNNLRFSVPKVLFISYDKRKKVGRVHTSGDPLVSHLQCSFKAAFSETYEIIEPKFPLWNLCTKKGYSAGMFVLDFKINRFTGDMVLEHWPNKRKKRIKNESIVSSYTSTQSEKIKYKCSRQQF